MNSNVYARILIVSDHVELDNYSAADIFISVLAASAHSATLLNWIFRRPRPTGWIALNRRSTASPSLFENSSHRASLGIMTAWHSKRSRRGKTVIDTYRLLRTVMNTHTCTHTHTHSSLTLPTHDNVLIYILCSVAVSRCSTTAVLLLCVNKSSQ